MTITSFTLTSAVTNASAPFSLGHAFRKGDVPAGSQVVGDIPIQVTPKTTWPDGSLRLAVISGTTALTAGTPKVVVISIGTPASGTTLTTANLKSTGITASIDAGAFGAVSWTGTDWDSPHETWVAGPAMSWFRYRKPIGADAHLVAWLDVRVWAGGQVAVKAWMENGYWNVAAPTNKLATYTFTLGGTQRYSGALDIKHHTRVVLLNGTELEHWLGTDPGVSPDRDIAYFISTEMVPKYSGTATMAALASTTNTFTPHMVGGFIYNGDYGVDVMNNPGYQRPIGLLPEHDVAYLICTDNRALAHASVVRNGYAVGRYPIHYRDHTTQKPPLFSTYSHMSVYDDDSIYGSGNANTKTPPNTGGINSRYEIAHSPSVGYFAYLTTGDKYHLETALFAANVAYFAVTPSLPEASDPVRIYPLSGSTMQTRAAAWGWRALAQGLTILPDSETVLIGEYADLAERIIDRYSRIYIEQANNPYGWVQPGEGYDPINGGKTHSPWQMGLLTGAFGYSVSLDLPIAPASRSKLSAFFQWKAKDVVTLLGPQSGFWYVNAAPYRVVVSTTTTPDYAGGAGPWLTPAESYAATYSVSQGFTPSTTEGVLAAEYDSGTWGVGMWGNLHLPIAYAVRHGVPGALDSYNRMVGASNYSAIQSTFDGGSPVWSLEPAFIGTATLETETPMGQTIRCDSASLIAGKIVCGNRGLGVLGSMIPADAGGDTSRPGFGYPSIQPSDLGKEVRFVITRFPTNGTLTALEDTSFTYTGATDSFDFTKYVAGAADGSASGTINVGAVASTTPVGAEFPQSYAILINSVVPVGAEFPQSYAIMSGEIPPPLYASPSCTVNFDGGTNRVDF